MLGSDHLPREAPTHFHTLTVQKAGNKALICVSQWKKLNSHFTLHFKGAICRNDLPTNHKITLTVTSP